MYQCKISREMLLFCAICAVMTFTQCTSSESPEPPAGIKIISGNNQYSKYGTELPEPFVVEVTTEGGSAAGGVAVVFQPTAGGGSFSKSKVTTNDAGIASNHFTLGPVEGNNTATVFVEIKSSLSVLFTATASYAFCPEAETTLTVSFGTQGHLLLSTPRSGFYPDHSGIFKINPSGGQLSPFIGFPKGFFITQVWDIAFSPRGDLFISTSAAFDEILKAAPDGSYSYFASLDIQLYPAAELTCNPAGLVVGCNNKGPFIVTCESSIKRFTDATYTGGINNDAVAVDPVTEDIYFIHEAQGALLRLPIDTLEAAGPVETVASLTADEATGARGMVCDSDRMIYILVDTDATKKILRVSAVDGTKSDLFDFFSRGSGTPQEAGIQRDLALNAVTNSLYTLDTLNDQLLMYSLPNGTLNISVQDTSLSPIPEGGERTGIVVIK